MKHLINLSLVCILFLPFQSVVDAGGKSSALKIVGKFAIGILADAAREGLIDHFKRNKNIGYSFTISWKTYTGVYTGVIVMNNNTGYFRVTTPYGAVIDQNMEALAPNGDIILRGSNPRLAETSNPAYNYYPDSFRLVESSNGWYVADTCDAQGLCSSVIVLSAKAI